MQIQFEELNKLKRPSFLTDEVLINMGNCKSFNALVEYASRFKNDEKNEVSSTLQKLNDSFIVPSIKGLEKNDFQEILNRMPKESFTGINASSLRKSFVKVKDTLSGNVVVLTDAKRGGSSDNCVSIIPYGTLQTVAGSLSVIVGIHFTAASLAVASMAAASTLLSLAGPIGAGVICVGLMIVLGGYLYCKYKGAQDDPGKGFNIEDAPLPPPLSVPYNVDGIVKAVMALIGKDHKEYEKLLREYFAYLKTYDIDNVITDISTYDICSYVLDALVENYMIENLPKTTDNNENSPRRVHTSLLNFSDLENDQEWNAREKHSKTLNTLIKVEKEFNSKYDYSSYRL